MLAWKCPNTEYWGVSSEEDTAVKAWADQLAGDPFAGDLDYGCGDKIKWLGAVSDNTPQRFIELRRAKADKRWAQSFIFHEPATVNHLPLPHRAYFNLCFLHIEPLGNHVAAIIGLT